MMHENEAEIPGVSDKAKKKIAKRPIRYIGLNRMLTRILHVFHHPRQYDNFDWSISELTKYPYESAASRRC